MLFGSQLPLAHKELPADDRRAICQVPYDACRPLRLRQTHLSVHALRRRKGTQLHHLRHRVPAACPPQWPQPSQPLVLPLARLTRLPSKRPEVAIATSSQVRRSLSVSIRVCVSPAPVTKPLGSQLHAFPRLHSHEWDPIVWSVSATPPLPVPVDLPYYPSLGMHVNRKSL